MPATPVIPAETTRMATNTHSGKTLTAATVVLEVRCNPIRLVSCSASTNYWVALSPRAHLTKLKKVTATGLKQVREHRYASFCVVMRKQLLGDRP